MTFPAFSFYFLICQTEMSHLRSRKRDDPHRPICDLCIMCSSLQYAHSPHIKKFDYANHPAKRQIVSVQGVSRVAISLNGNNSPHVNYTGLEQMYWDISSLRISPPAPGFQSPTPSPMNSLAVNPTLVLPYL